MSSREHRDEKLPISGPMTRDRAHMYVELTEGAYEARQNGDGTWTLYASLVDQPPAPGRAVR